MIKNILLLLMKPTILVGGQAVIEGVMMRVPGPTQQLLEILKVKFILIDITLFQLLKNQIFGSNQFLEVWQVFMKL